MRRSAILLTGGLAILPLVLLFALVHTASAGKRASAAETVLYDGSLGTLPAAQGMLYQAADTSPLGDSVEVVQKYTGGGARLDSTADYEDAAGYSSTAAALDRQQGVLITFTVQITSEDHTTSGTADKDNDGIADRAGFSVIAISSDGQNGIELGFWEDKIWAQEGGGAPALFTHAEEADFDTSSLTTYELLLLDNRYVLAVAGSTILSGTLRDYTAFGGFIDPYETPNFLFFGDDTSSASADIKLTAIMVRVQAEDGGHRTLLPLVVNGS